MAAEGPMTKEETEAQEPQMVDMDVVETHSEPSDLSFELFGVKIDHSDLELYGIDPMMFYDIHYDREAPTQTSVLKDASTEDREQRIGSLIEALSDTDYSLDKAFYYNGDENFSVSSFNPREFEAPASSSQWLRLGRGPDESEVASARAAHEKEQVLSKLLALQIRLNHQAFRPEREAPQGPKRGEEDICQIPGFNNFIADYYQPVLFAHYRQNSRILNREEGKVIPEKDAFKARVFKP